MKHFGAGLVALGGVVMLSCLVTACMVSRDGGPGPTQPPAGQSPEVPPNAETESACVGVPTLAPPRENMAVRSSTRVAKHPFGQVVLVRIEVDAAGRP